MQYNHFFFEFYYISSFLQEKIFLENLRSFFFKIKFHFILKNNISNRILFLLKIMLLKKLMNNKISFLFNKYLLKKKQLKIGGFFEIGNQKLYDFFLMCFLYSLPKLIFFSKTFFFLYDFKFDRYADLFFFLNKILFFNYFSYNLDYNSYYEFFENTAFHLKIKVSTCFKYYYLNRDLFRLSGLNIV